MAPESGFWIGRMATGAAFHVPFGPSFEAPSARARAFPLDLRHGDDIDIAIDLGGGVSKGKAGLFGHVFTLPRYFGLCQFCGTYRKNRWT